MSELATLWLPILLSGIAVFFASFLAWVVIGHHAPDWSEIPDEGNVIDFIRAGIEAGAVHISDGSDERSHGGRSQKTADSVGAMGDTESLESSGQHGPQSVADICLLSGDEFLYRLSGNAGIGTRG